MLPARRHTGSIFLVIASEAKQSILSLRGEMDCFAALAMTVHKYDSAPSPRICARAVDNSSAQLRAQGRPGARCTRGLVCKHAQKHAHEHTGSAESIRPSLRNGFTAYSALSPATGFVATVAARILPRHLTPASGRQDHTTSPYARMHSRQKHSLRPPHPIPTFVTMANAPRAE
jgi:hypothetical protein